MPDKPQSLPLVILHKARQKRFPLTSRIVLHSLFTALLVLGLFSTALLFQLRQTWEEQASMLGQTLTSQTASQAAKDLMAKDLLSLNILLGNLVRNPLVAHASIRDTSNRTLAEAGAASSRGEGRFTTTINLQDVTIGHLSVALDPEAIHRPQQQILRNMGIVLGVLLLLVLVLALRFARRQITPLKQLVKWLESPSSDRPAPGNERNDEIGDLSLHLQSTRPRAGSSRV